jgi:DNA-binding transcriptional MerR regulator
MSMQYQIGEFAELSGVSAKTLRFYDEIGLLHPASVDPRTGYRRYLPQQLQELASILALKNLGVSLAKLRKLTDRKASIASQPAILNELKETIEHSIHTAAKSLEWINTALNEIQSSKPPIAVIVKRRLALPIASLRAKINNYAEVSMFEDELSSMLPADCIGNLRGVLWHRCADSGALEAEAFVTLKRPIPRDVACERKHLPDATLACAYSALDDESSERVYAAIKHWMSVRGYRLAGPKRELNFGQILEVQFPLVQE